MVAPRDGVVQGNAHHVIATCDIFSIEVKGKGGHIGAPHATVDPVAIGAQIVTNQQHLVAREVDPVRSWERLQPDFSVCPCGGTDLPSCRTRISPYSPARRQPASYF